MTGDAETALPAYIAPAGPGLWKLHVRAAPGAKRDALDGEVEGRIRVRLAAPAVDGKANDALIAFLAKRLGLRRSALELALGQTNRQKTILVRQDAPPVLDPLSPRK